LRQKLSKEECDEVAASEKAKEKDRNVGDIVDDPDELFFLLGEGGTP